MGALALSFLYPLLYLIPGPLDLWAALPGHPVYAEGLALLPDPGAAPWRPFSIAPALTEASWLALIPPLAVFLGGVALPGPYLRVLVTLALGMAVGQALLSLMQYGAGTTSPLCLGNLYCGGGGGTGTYVNRDHLAGLLELMLPVGLSLLAATVGRAPRVKRHRPSWRERLLSLSSWRRHVVALYGAASIALLVGLIFTRSRSGLTLAMLGILLALFAFSGRLGGSNAFGAVGTVTAVGLALAVEIGLVPVLQRFTLEDPLQDSRWAIFESTLRGIGSFFPLGSGPGTYPQVYPQFQPLELGTFFINHAHNDYLEWLFEGGLMSAALLLLWLVLYLRQWSKVGTRGAWTTLRFTQAGAGIGLCLMLLHALVDFNWHIPANALYTAFLAAVFFHPPEGHEGQAERRSMPRRHPRQAQSVSPVPLPSSSEPVRNPFLD